jgi:hypothetical protein
VNREDERQQVEDGQSEQPWRKRQRLPSYSSRPRNLHLGDESNVVRRSASKHQQRGNRHDAKNEDYPLPGHGAVSSATVITELGDAGGAGPSLIRV